MNTSFIGKRGPDLFTPHGAFPHTELLVNNTSTNGEHGWRKPLGWVEKIEVRMYAMRAELKAERLWQEAQRHVDKAIARAVADARRELGMQS